MRVPIRKPGKYTHAASDRHVTAGKLQEYRNELERLFSESRPRAIAEVKRLAELGDFSENAEYQIAKGRLRGINERIDELNKAINGAIVIDSGTGNGTVQIGSRVTIVIGGKEKKYQLLGSAETDPEQGIISQASPLGAALIGRRVGQKFTATLAGKEVECTVLSVE